jgi:hypothetical protein
MRMEAAISMHPRLSIIVLMAGGFRWVGDVI